MKIPLKKLLVHSFVFLFFFLVCLVLADHYLSVRLAVSKTEDTYKSLAGLLEETVRSAAETFSIRLDAVSDISRHHMRDIVQNFPADGKSAESLAEEFAASSGREYGIIVFDAEGRKAFSGRSAGSADSWTLAPSAEDFDGARKGTGGIMRIRYSQAKNSSEIMFFEWIPEYGKYAAVMTEYSFADEIASRMSTIQGGSSLFDGIGIYSLGETAAESFLIYGEAFTQEDLEAFRSASDGTFFRGYAVYNVFICEAEQLFPWSRIGIKAVLKPEGINRMKQGSLMLALMTILFSALFMYYVFGIFRRRFEIPYSEAMRLFGESKRISLSERGVYVTELKELVNEYNRHLEQTESVLERLENCKEDLKKRSEDEAERLEKQKEFMIQQMKLYSIGEMVASVSHHWREPLSLVHINMQNIKEEISSGIEDEKYLDECISTCREQIGVMKESVDRFLGFVSRDEGADERFEAMPLLDEVHSFVSTYYEKDGIGFVFFSDSSKTEIKGSASVLKQILLNVIMVSRELVETNGVGVGTITLRAENENGACVIKIEDSTGKFRDACVSALEDPLNVPGLKKAMGLYISSKLIEKNFGGRLEAVPSEKGTLFKIIIP
ncbi:MAG: sensor histidine kinase [Deferribacterales bacterium]